MRIPNPNSNGYAFACITKRPGPQPANQNAPTFQEQFARALAPRLTSEQAARTELVSLIEDVVRSVLLAELPAAVEYLFRREAGRAAA